jgi:O-antigen ligase
MTVGGIMMVSTLLVVPFIVHRETPRAVRWLAVAVSIPLMVNLLFTFTRSSWLGFLAGITVIAVRRHRRVVFPALVLVLAVVFASTPDMKDRMLSMFDPYHPTNITRLNMWEVGWKMFLDHPLLGIGDIGTEQIWDRYSEPGWTPEGHLHNNLVMWLATLGILGFASLVALFATIWRTVAAIERSTHGDWLLGSVTLGGLAVFAGFHVNGLFEWNFGDAEIIVLFWSTVGLSLAAGRIGKGASTA